MMTQEEFMEVQRMHAEGMTFVEIAEATGYHRTTIANWIKTGGPAAKRQWAIQRVVLTKQWRTRIAELLEAQPALLSTSIHDLLAAEGFTGSYVSDADLRPVRPPTPRVARHRQPPQRARPPNPHRTTLELQRRTHHPPQPRLPRRGVLPRHPPPHTPLIDPDLFDTAQRLMTERGEDAAKRAGNSSGYLLTNVLICAKCGKRFVGTAANGNRYRYYTCYSRQRHGTKTCDAERLPADELEQAVLQALLACYEQHDLIGEAIQAAWNRAEATRDQRQAELDVVDAEIAKTELAIDRYLLAFETGDLPQAQCGERRTQAPTPELLARVRARVKRVLDAGPNATRKTVIEELVTRFVLPPATTSNLVPPTLRLAGGRGSYAYRFGGPDRF